MIKRLLFIAIFCLSAHTAFAGLAADRMRMVATSTPAGPCPGYQSGNSCVYTVPGTYTFIASSVTVSVKVWGAGGNSTPPSDYGQGGVGGAGGGAYSGATVTVTSGNSYSVKVGQGMCQSCAGLPGEDSYFWNATTVMAKGGGKTGDNAGASGGQASAGYGTIKYSGGAGYSTGGADNGGGGGGGASSTADGGTSIGITGGNSLSGGTGGDGGPVDGIGADGLQPGGGGGGAGNGSSTIPGASGFGGHGKVIISW